MENLKQHVNNYPSSDIKPVCHYLFGDDWVAGITNEFSLNRRTVDRWKSGEQAIPPGLWVKIIDMAAEKMIHDVVPGLTGLLTQYNVPHSALLQFLTLPYPSPWSYACGEEIRGAMEEFFAEAISNDS